MAAKQHRAFMRSIPMVPAIILMAVFLIGPVLASFFGSFTNSALTGAAAARTEFVGLDNYLALFSSKEFPQSVWLTVVFVFCSAVIGQNIVGLLLAALLRASGRILGAIVSTAVIGAWILPDIVSAYAAYAFFSEEGTLNAMISRLGLTPIQWLVDHPMLAIILGNTWRGTAFSMLIYSAALSEIPEEITEAAEVDGAGGAQRFFLITLPMIKGSISTNLMLITLQTLSVFTMIYVMTGGGPSNRSMTLPVLAYQEALQFGEIGYGTAIATILLIVGAIFAVVYVRALRNEVQT